MSSDMMLVCEEDNNYYSGKPHDEILNKRKNEKESAVFIDECSMGEPWSDFGKWFQERFCKGPSMLEQVMGKKDHDWMVLSEQDIISIKDALGKMKTHKDIDKDKLIKYLESHIGKHISTENW